MVQSKTNRKTADLDQILMDTGRAISEANLKIYQSIPPLLEYALNVSQKGKRIVLTDRHTMELPNPKDGQIKEYTVWYEAKDGRVEKIAYDPDSDVLDPGDTFTTALTQEEFLRMSMESINTARGVYNRLERFRRAYEHRDINKRDAYSKFF